LLAYPIGSKNDILIEQIRRNRALYAHVRSSVAFKELEKEADEKRERDMEGISAIVDSAGGQYVE
jgi:VIT1/CCC1 family predicted Fe2+/Mn2+ transporter